MSTKDQVGLEEATIWPPGCIYIEEKLTTLGINHTLINHVDFCAKTRIKTIKFNGERRIVFCPNFVHTCELFFLFLWGCYRSKISRIDHNSKIWPALAFVDHDLLEMAYKRVDLTMCGNVGIGLGSCISHLYLIL